MSNEHGNAKKLYLNSGKYARLRHYHFDEHYNKIMQIDQLHNFALQARAIPAYCFYNGGEELRQRGSSLAGEHGDYIDKTYGCSISGYAVVRRQHDSRSHNSKTFAALHPRRHSFPWSALVQRHHEWMQKFSSDDHHPLIEKQPGISHAVAPSLGHHSFAVTQKYYAQLRQLGELLTAQKRQGDPAQ